MSRSFKKEPVGRANSIAGNYNKKFRSKNKIRVNQGLEPLEELEVTNQYDVCDYKFREVDNPKLYRK